MEAVECPIHLDLVSKFRYWLGMTAVSVTGEMPGKYCGMEEVMAIVCQRISCQMV
jgi:hypothetical protein